jgi:hypothetical protein
MPTSDRRVTRLTLVICRDRTVCQGRTLTILIKFGDTPTGANQVAGVTADIIALGPGGPRTATSGRFFLHNIMINPMTKLIEFMTTFVPVYICVRRCTYAYRCAYACVCVCVWVFVSVRNRRYEPTDSYPGQQLWHV